jgi:hypothetical protein
MQKSIISATIIGLFVAMMPLNAQKTSNEVGLTIKNIRPKTATLIAVKPVIKLIPQLDLPKLDDPSLRLRDNDFYPQSLYPELYAYYNSRKYYQEVNERGLYRGAPGDLLFGRVMEAIFTKVFGYNPPTFAF